MSDIPLEEQIRTSIQEQMQQVLLPIMDRFNQLEQRLSLAVVKESYTTEEVAQRLERAEWTVRQWCNKGQVAGAKKVRGRGRMGEWRIPHEEVVRLQNEGPLPLKRSEVA
jgi:transposase